MPTMERTYHCFAVATGAMAALLGGASSAAALVGEHHPALSWIDQFGVGLGWAIRGTMIAVGVSLACLAWPRRLPPEPVRREHEPSATRTVWPEAGPRVEALLSWLHDRHRVSRRIPDDPKTFYIAGVRAWDPVGSLAPPSAPEARVLALFLARTAGDPLRLVVTQNLQTGQVWEASVDRPTWAAYVGPALRGNVLSVPTARALRAVSPARTVVMSPAQVRSSCSKAA